MAGPYSNSPIHFFESVSAVTATPTVEIGTRRREGNDEYIYVYNDGGEQISPSYAARLNSAVSGYSVTISSVCQVGRFVGVVKHSTITTAAYGWLLTKGFSQIEMGATESAAAGLLVCAAINGTFKEVSAVSGNHAQAEVMTAVASGASTGAWVFMY